MLAVEDETARLMQTARRSFDEASLAESEALAIYLGATDVQTLTVAHFAWEMAVSTRRLWWDRLLTLSEVR